MPCGRPSGLQRRTRKDILIVRGKIRTLPPESLYELTVLPNPQFVRIALLFLKRRDKLDMSDVLNSPFSTFLSKMTKIEKSSWVLRTIVANKRFRRRTAQRVF